MKPDVVIELGWRANLMDFAMPFMINTICEQTRKVLPSATETNIQLSTLEAWVEEKKKEAQAQQKVEEETPIIGMGGQRLIGYGGANGYVS